MIDTASRKFRYSLNDNETLSRNSGWRFEHTDWLGSCRPLRSPVRDLVVAATTEQSNVIDDLLERI